MKESDYDRAKRELKEAADKLRRSRDYSKEEQAFNCSFCEKDIKEVDELISGKNAFICNECVELCHDMLNEDNGKDI